MMAFPGFRQYRDSRGMALLITIMVVSLLIAVTVQFNRKVRTSFFGSASLLESRQLQAIALSGLTIGQAMLEVDGAANGYDDLLDIWASTNFSEMTDLFETGALRLDVADLSGRLQVNSLVREGEQAQEGNVVETVELRGILKRLLLLGIFDITDETQAQEIIDALTDWIDADDRESDYGAEDSYYQSLNPPYSCKNGPVETMEELLLVKGITPELLYGGPGRPGLADFLTVYGTDGHININTAPAELLQALHPLMTEDLAISLEEYRQDEGNIEKLEDPGWYRNITAWPGDIDLPPMILSTKSFFFQLRSSGTYQDLARRVTAVVERDSDNNTEILYKTVE